MTLDARKTILLETQEKTFHSLGSLSEEELLEGKGVPLLDTLCRLADQLRELELPQTAEGTYEPDGCPEKETVTTAKPQADLPEEATQAPAPATPTEYAKTTGTAMTIDDVRVKLTPYIQAGLDMPKLMGQLGLPAKLSQVDPGDYARLVEAAEKAAKEG